MKTQTIAIDDNIAKNFQAAFQMGVTVPLKVLVPLWQFDESTLCRMARDGRIPGAYKKGGSWWIWPKLLTEPVEDNTLVRSASSRYREPARQRRCVR
jgi:hypothetical protein